MLVEERRVEKPSENFTRAENSRHAGPAPLMPMSGQFVARTANKSVEAAPRSALQKMCADLLRSVVFRAPL
jgi:hypothetical protein